ncbi:MAG: sortase family protein [Thermoleophilia bacterium]|nr:sortase family protein [Thermoleophilia bacterium]MCZ4496202.1 sortase family protein [Thermoleophilia bacterium]
MDRLTYPDIARIFGTGLISTGLGLLLFVLVTVFWGDPFTRLSENSAQDKLERAFAEYAPAADELRAAAVDPELTRTTAAVYKKRSPLGSNAGKLDIPSINLHKVFVHGARDEPFDDLQKGPGLYKEVAFPGSGQPLAIAGHRTTYGAPFLNIDQLDPGEIIRVTMPYGVFTYTVTRQQVIAPNDWSILDYGAAERTGALRQRVKTTSQCLGAPRTCEHLVLTACHPKYSAARRLAVFAKLSKVQLASTGAAAA